MASSLVISATRKPEAFMAKPTTRHKYNAQKVVVEDKTFDSKKEAGYYLYLRSLWHQRQNKKA